MWKQYYNQVQKKISRILWSRQFFFFLSQVVDFCDDDDDPNTGHHRSSNTAQNRFCNMQSVWGVMHKTVDFRDGANPPRDVTSTKPTFRVRKHDFIDDRSVRDEAGGVCMMAHKARQYPT